VPLPIEPAQPDDLPPAGLSTDLTPVFALKQIVARLQRDQHKIQDLLSSLGFALRSFNNLNQFLDLIPLVTTRVTDAEASVLLARARDARLQLQRLHSLDPQFAGDVRMAIEQGLSQFGAASGGQRLTLTPSEVPEKETIAQFDALLRSLVGDHLRFFGTPIVIQNEERGRLYIFSRDPQYEWNDMRRKLVQLIADQTAVAIFNDELMTELRHKQRLDRELEIGAEIQLQLFPSQCPQVPGIELAARCTPASRVGGDYYDFIPTDYNHVHGEHEHEEMTEAVSVPSRWGIAIGDVMGKGVPAGLLMTLTRGMLRAEALNSHSPAHILQHLNRAMYADLENSHRFVTLFYSEYDAATRQLAYSNAAHNPPLFWRSRTDTIERLDTWGMLVGLDADTEYEEDRITLEPGDTILYYTDGFTEASNPEGDRFDEDNLIDVFQSACRQRLQPTEILEFLFATVGEFVGVGRSNDDDMTLVVLQSTR